MVNAISVQFYYSLRRDIMPENKKVGQKHGRQTNDTSPEPLSGSKKVKQKNHSRQNKNPGHDM
jgi:small acid-soluble spore protein P (minor)